MRTHVENRTKSKTVQHMNNSFCLFDEEGYIHITQMTSSKECAHTGHTKHILEAMKRANNTGINPRSRRVDVTHVALWILWLALYLPLHACWPCLCLIRE